MVQEYIVNEAHYRKRWHNRKDFIKNITNTTTKKHTHTLLILCYNHIEQFFSLLDHISLEPLYGDFAITIIQNSDKPESLDLFESHIGKYKEIITLYPKENMGSAGGYALGHEFCMNSDFTHCIMIEDDVQLYEKNTVSSTIEHSMLHIKDVVFINAPNNTGGVHSWYVQYVCYPIDLLRVIGGIDPRYYFRGEDLERRQRVEYGINILQLKKIILPYQYYHPYIKATNNNGSWIYFSLRNQLWTIREYKSFSLRFMLIIMQYIAYGFLIYFRGKKKVILANIYYALIDGIGNTKSLSYNKKMLKKLGLYNPASIQDIGFTSNNIDREEMLYNINVKSLISTTSISIADRELLAKNHGTIIASGGFQPVRGLVVSCLQKAHIIEYMQLDKHILSGKKIKQSMLSRIGNLLLFLPCSFLGWFIGLLYSVYIILFQHLRHKHYLLNNTYKCQTKM